MKCTCAILSSKACPALQYFSTLSHKLHDFRKKKVIDIHNVFLFHLQILSETFLILRRRERDMIKEYIGLYVKYRLLLSDVNAI